MPEFFRLFFMDQRLDIIIKLIDMDSKGVCDVGTDHGFIPVRLASEGFSGSIIASDINAAPLKRAEENACSVNVQDRINFCRYNGLPEHLSESFDTAVIAGMGGDLICSILDKADFIFSESYTLILQPMTKPEIVRYYLVNNGFTITEDYLAEDRNRLYQIIKCSFTSVNDLYSDLELFSGKKSRCNDLLLYERMILKLRKHFLKAAEGSDACGDHTKADFYRELLEQINFITG